MLAFSFFYHILYHIILNRCQPYISCCKILYIKHSVFVNSVSLFPKLDSINLFLFIRILYIFFHSIYHADFSSFDAVVTDINFVSMNIELFTSSNIWDYIVIDETGRVKYANDDFCLLMKLSGNSKVFVSREDIFFAESFNHFRNIVRLLFDNNQQNIYENLLLLLSNKSLTKRNELFEYFCELRLRRYREEIADGLPLIDKEVSRFCFKNNE